MEFLLRHAGTLKQACTDAIGALSIEPTVRISVNQITSELPSEVRDTARDRLATESENVRARLNDIRDLMEARGEIRFAIKQANQLTIGGLPSVEFLLNQKGVLDARIGSLKATHGKFRGKPTDPYARMRNGETQHAKHDETEVAAAIQVTRNRLQTVTTGDVANYIEVDSLPDSEVKRIETEIAALKRRLSEVMDELAAANLRARIDLSDKTVKALRKHGIIEPDAD